MKKLALLAAAAFAIGSFTSTSTAQEQQRQRGGGEDMRARMTESLRTLLDVKNEDEWKLLYARLEKVREARDEVRAVSGDFRLLFNIGRPGEQGGAAPGGDRGGRGPGGFGGGTPNPDSEALSKAITNKAPTEELKQRMARLRDARKAAEAKYEKLSEELRQLLTVRQEAALVAIGSLK